VGNNLQNQAREQPCSSGAVVLHSDIRLRSRLERDEAKGLLNSYGSYLHLRGMLVCMHENRSPTPPFSLSGKTLVQHAE